MLYTQSFEVILNSFSHHVTKPVGYRNLPIKAIRKFIKLESSGGIVLFAMTLIALLISNSPFSINYQQLFDTTLGLKIADFKFEKSISWWINDTLMLFFFLMVCLEIKWEMVKGELNSFSSMMLPLIAALGGMSLPAIIYMLINWQNPAVHSGWAIPTATDIAFSLGILSLLGSRVPLTLKLFLSAVAIFDDLGAIVIIAFFYTNTLSFPALLLAFFCLLLLFALNRTNVTKISPYLIVGFFLWLCLLNSGIHPTLAGVATAFAIPVHRTDLNKPYPTQYLSGKLHPWVVFLILPLFAFANAGISFSSGLTANDLINPLALGIAAGLFIGKQIGIFGATFLAIKFKLCKLPKDIRWSNLYGISLICGIGFTMSLFIGSLAFNGMNQDTYEALVRWGVMLGSFTSGVLGYLFLYFNLEHSHSPKKVA